MTIVHAINAIRDNGGWARPLSWNGSGQAVSVHAGAFLIMPRRARFWTATAKDIIAGWEMVTPEQVEQERA
jgi:hypothetical protein